MHKQLSSVIAPTCPPCTGGRKVLDSFTLASAARDGGGEVMRSWFYSSQGAVLRLTDEVNFSVCLSLVTKAGKPRNRRAQPFRPAP